MDQCNTALEKLVRIGIALSAVRDLEKLLEMIVSQAREFARADAGSLYIVEGEHLNFVVSQNDTLAKREGKRAEEMLFKPFPVPLSKKSLSGYVALTGEALNIPDAYHIPETAPYGFDRSFDERSSYRTKSMLQLPMRDTEGAIIGVLQLINAVNEKGEIAPFSGDDQELLSAVASQAAVAVRNAQLHRDIRQAHLDTIVRLGVAAEYRDKETGNHIRRMSHYSQIIAEKMGLTADQVEIILLASPMHDVGKVGIPDAVLLKPGRLNEVERKIIESHCIIGAEILKGSDVPLMKLSQTIAFTHHEKWDGTGYPTRLKGTDIPVEGRIVALADVFDALTNKRVYKPAMSLDDTMTIIREGSGAHFDPAVVEAFQKGWDKVTEVYDQYKEI